MLTILWLLQSSFYGWLNTFEHILRRLHQLEHVQKCSFFSIRAWIEVIQQFWTFVIQVSKVFKNCQEDVGINFVLIANKLGWSKKINLDLSFNIEMPGKTHWFLFRYPLKRKPKIWEHTSLFTIMRGIYLPIKILPSFYKLLVHPDWCCGVHWCAWTHSCVALDHSCVLCWWI